MDFVELLEKRYATKMYKQTKVVEKEKIEKLKQTLRLSISSINSQPWKFYIVQDKDKKSQFASASFFNKEKIEAGSHLIIFCVMRNSEVFERKSKEYMQAEKLEFYHKALKPQGEEVVENWMTNQLYISLGMLTCACAAYQIDSTPMEGIDKDLYDKILSDKDYKPVFAVVIGERDPQDKNQPSLTPKSRREQQDIIEVI